MLYVFYGTDGGKAQQKAMDTLRALQKKAPHASTTRMDDEAITESSIADALAEHGLFKSEQIVYLDARSGGIDAIVDAREVCASSASVVLVLAGKIKADHLKKIEKVAVKCQEFEKEKKVQERNMFALSDLLLTKDSRGLFVELEKMRLDEVKGEEVVGILFWAAKTMVLASHARTSAESGLKPFVFQKAKKGAEVWGSSSAKKLLTTLAHAPHKARRDGVDLFNELEAITMQ